MTSRICWWLVELVTRLLDEPERDVVRGDLAECGSRPGCALREVLGLVVRRQAALWVDWRPWFAVAGVVAPIGFLLSHVSRWWGVTTAINGMHYWILWDFAYLAVPGWRDDLIRIVAITITGYITLMGWSWTSGFVLGRLSGRTRWLIMTMLCLVVLAGTWGTMTTAQPRPRMPALQYHIVFVVFPRLARACLVMLPALWGAHRGEKRCSLPLVPTVVGVVLLAGGTALYSNALEGSIVFGRRSIPSDSGPDGFVVSAGDPRPLWFLPLVMIWPAAYILATTAMQRWRSRRLLV